MTLVEVMLASVLLTVALFPVLNSLGSLGFTFHRTYESTHAAFLAQSLMEGIRYRLYDQDSRFYTLNDLEPRREELVQERKYETFFRGLAETDGAKIVESSDGSTSRYFVEFENLQGTGLHGINAQSNPELFRELASYSASVWIYFDSPQGSLDSNGDDKNEVDMADIKVTLRWVDLKDGEHNLDFWSTLTRYQYEPHRAP